jgi:hypothetical protein
MYFATMVWPTSMLSLSPNANGDHASDSVVVAPEHLKLSQSFITLKRTGSECNGEVFDDEIIDTWRVQR